MPDTPTPETLRALVEKWRARVGQPGMSDPASNAYEECADELAALLDTAP